MIRLTLRQFRAEAAITFALLTALAIVLALTGPHLDQVNQAFQATCTTTGSCSSAANPVFAVDQGLQALVPILAIIAPGLIGMFFGAPLVARELETGTFRVAWTQSVTRRRWLAVRLILTGLATVTVAGLLTWVVVWWDGPLDAASQRTFDPVNFSIHGVVAIGYAAFAFALGVAAGTLLRRTVAAMGATLVGFVVARVAVTDWVRPNLAAPLHESLPFLTARPGFSLDASAGSLSLTPPLVRIPDAWVYSTSVVNPSGDTLTGQYVLHACPALDRVAGTGPAANPLAAVRACQDTLSATFHTLVTYQPASRFWPFQWAELGIFLAAALALCGLTFWWLRHRLA